MHVYIDFSPFLLPYQENRQLLNIPQFRAAPPFFFGIILCMVMIWYQAKGEQLIAVVGEKDKTFLLSGIEAGITILYCHGS